jgi:hypothetical protein
VGEKYPAQAVGLQPVAIEENKTLRQRLKLSCKPGERFVFFYGDRLETNGLGRVFLAPGLQLSFSRWRTSSKFLP